MDLDFVLFEDAQWRILEAVDEYTLYCFYTSIDNLQPGIAYHSPVRPSDNTDERPSFTVFESTKYDNIDYMWKDQALGVSGSIFGLVKRVCNLDSDYEVYNKIASDFSLDFKTIGSEKKIVMFKRPERECSKIRVKSIPFTQDGKLFWDRLRISSGILNQYCTTQIQYYWSYEKQLAPTYARDPTFAYRVGNYYQIYQPKINNIDKLFRQDLPPNYFLGYIQLPQRGKVLVIDKSMKDVMFCRRLGYDAVCGKSETTMIPHNKIMELKSRFSDIFLMLDNDEAGRRQTQRYMELYPWMKPRFLSEAKDKTDLCIKVGFGKAEETIKQLIK